jgi:hypothetical protein
VIRKREMDEMTRADEKRRRSSSSKREKRLVTL